MAAKAKFQLDLPTLTQRLQRARNEGRTVTALELAREAHKRFPSPDHQSVYRDVLMERGDQLLREGRNAEAAQLFVNAMPLATSPEFKALLAEKLAAVGMIAQARELFASLPAGVPGTAVAGILVDAALIKGPPGKAELSADLHAGFDQILQAFDHSAKERDDDARAALQPIGLQSPFLEWKVFLRGLLAYYAGDDAKALENWQRLEPKRTPWRLSAPLRSQIDPVFREAQSSDTQQSLRKAFQRSQGNTLTASLEEIHRCLNDKKKLSAGFRLAKQVAPVLQRDYPKLLPRLAYCFFWAVVDKGVPDHLDLFADVFGSAPDDSPDMHRLQALATEMRGADAVSHAAWQAFEHWVLREPQNWPAGQTNFVRAVIWERMGCNAKNVEEETDAKLTPDAETCLRRSIELAPGRLQPHAILVRELYESEDAEKRKSAIKAGRELLAHFPDHVTTLVCLGHLYLEQDKPELAAEFYERALKVNPLERRLRDHLGRAHFANACRLATGPVLISARKKWVLNPAEFRAALEKALAFMEGNKTYLLCRWAFLEKQIKDEAGYRAAIDRALAVPHQRVAVAYGLWCESARAKLKPALRKPYEQAFLDALQQSTTVEEFLSLAETAAKLHVPRFPNQPALEKSAQAALRKVPLKTLSEPQFETFCKHLNALGADTFWGQVCEEGLRLFPRNVGLRLGLVEKALKGASRKRRNWSTIYNMKTMLEKVRAHWAELPKEQQEKYTAQIEACEEQLRDLQGPDIFSRLLNFGFGEVDEEDEDEDEEFY